MKKLIVLSVVFALVASTAAFAVDLGGDVIGGVNLLVGQAGDGADTDTYGGGYIKRFRVSGSGEAGDGKFGGMVRLNHEDKGDETDVGFYGNVWWKPIDQFKLLIGSNGGDGFYGKEGVTGWGFYQTVSDSNVVNPGNCWGGGFGNNVMRDSFFGGDGGENALRLEITPIDILGINISLPYFTGSNSWGGPSDSGKVEDIFKKAIAQIDLKLDFGNIALSYVGGLNDGPNQYSYDPSKIYVYYGGAFGDLSLDVGFAYTLASKDAAGDSYANPIGVGVGLKYATDAFGVKFRAGATLGGDDKVTSIIADVLPFFSLGDGITAYVSAGLAMVMATNYAGDDVTLTGWHFNPYLQIGEEWGTKFLIGIKVSQDAAQYRSDDTTWDWIQEKVIKWSIPIAIQISF